MAIFENWKIGTRLALGFGLVAAMFLVNIAMGLTLLKAVDNNAMRVVNQHLPNALGSGNREVLRFPHQPHDAASPYHCRHLQGALADRNLLSVHQAEPQDQIFPWQLGKCRSVSSLRGADRVSAPGLSEVHVKDLHQFALSGSAGATKSLSVLQHPRPR